MKKRFAHHHDEVMSCFVAFQRAMKEVPQERRKPVEGRPDELGEEVTETLSLTEEEDRLQVALAVAKANPTGVLALVESVGTFFEEMKKGGVADIELQELVRREQRADDKA